MKIGRILVCEEIYDSYLCSYIVRRCPCLLKLNARSCLLDLYLYFWCYQRIQWLYYYFIVKELTRKCQFHREIALRSPSSMACRVKVVQIKFITPSHLPCSAWKSWWIIATFSCSLITRNAIEIRFCKWFRIVKCSFKGTWCIMMHEITDACSI